MIDVAVLAGGRSPEHEVSRASGREVLRHLDRRRFRPWPVYLGKDGGWTLGEAGAAEFPTAAGTSRRPGAALDWLIESADLQVVFPVLHGPFGEDGTVQGMLDLHDIAYVGSGTAASAVAMDKIRTRQCLRANEVPMPPAYLPEVAVRAADPVHEAAAIEAAVGYPCFLKTDLSGSSLGVARADSAADVAVFLAEARTLGRRFLAEGGVVGEEISVPVLGNAGYGPEPLPPVGIYPVNDAYFTHEAKYDAAACEETVPPRGLSEAQIQEVQALALRCHEALQCDGLSRTDMIVTADGPLVLEVNTMPGFTPASLYPKAAAAAGLSYADLLSRLIDLALARPNQREQRP